MARDLEQYVLDHFDTAIERHYITPYFQPVIRTISRKLCGFEALARWVDAGYGVIRPDQFIPVLEEHQLIHRLDICIIWQVCGLIRGILDAEDIPVPISVNLSRLDFSLCDIFREVDNAVRFYQVPRNLINIEITESLMGEQEQLMRKVIAEFHGAGFQVWMDDFGSGYSSLNTLKDYRFDELKIDMHFLSSFDQRSRKILSSVIQMAKEIEIQTLAEGVETEEQFRFLRNTGCEKVQGYYFGKPMPYEDAMRHMEDSFIEIEQPSERKYYDDIGKINLLSAVPFMTHEEREAITTARQLNSIPLAIAEVHRDYFSILFYNTAFEETAKSSGLVSNIFTQEMLCMPQPFSILNSRVIHLMDSTRNGGEGKMNFISNEEYYQIRAKCIARTKENYSVLVRLDNLSKASGATRMTQLDEYVRQIYTLFERITLLDLDTDTITPLYVATREDLLSGRTGIKRLLEEYAERLVFPEDRDDYLKEETKEMRDKYVEHVAKMFELTGTDAETAKAKYDFESIDAAEEAFQRKLEERNETLRKLFAPDNVITLECPNLSIQFSPDGMIKMDDGSMFIYGCTAFCDWGSVEGHPLKVTADWHSIELPRLDTLSFNNDTITTSG